jgi:hypothetical protein
MDNFHPPVEMESRKISRRPSRTTKRQLAVGLLGILICCAMIAWFGFLGWGAVELGYVLIAAARKIWTIF